MIIRIICIAFLLILKVSYSNAQDFSLVKDAVYLGNDYYQITSESNNQLGAVWNNTQLNLNEGFDLELLINFGRNDVNGADGIAFVLQNQHNHLIGTSGAGLGFSGITPSLGVEFDTWNNSNMTDMPQDHIAILQNGDTRHLSSNNLVGPIVASVNSPNIEDAKDHLVRISWEPTTKTMEVYFDCSLRLRLVKDLITDIFQGNPKVWWGFTGSTGGSTNKQTIMLRKNVFFTKEITNICPNTPVQLVSRVSKDDTYTWTPTTRLNSSTIRLPIATPAQTSTYQVSYTNFCGIPVSDQVVIHVTPLPSISLDNPLYFCEGSSTEIIPVLNPSNLSTSFLWSTGETSPKITVNKEQTYVFSVTNGNCSTSVSTRTMYRPNPIVDLSQDMCIEVPIDAGRKQPNYTYFWKHSGEKSFSVKVNKPEQYQVIVTNEYGCSVTRTINGVSCQPTIYAPTIFTPNHDNQNDDFTLSITHGSIKKIVVFDRWGNMLFENEGNSIGWDGTSNNVDCPVGIYSYAIIYQRAYDNALLQHNGTVTLVR